MARKEVIKMKNSFGNLENNEIWTYSPTVQCWEASFFCYCIRQISFYRSVQLILISVMQEVLSLNYVFHATEVDNKVIYML